MLHWLICLTNLGKVTFSLSLFSFFNFQMIQLDLSYLLISKCIIIGLIFISLSQIITAMRTAILLELPYFQHEAQCLTHDTCPLNIHWMNERPTANLFLSSVNPKIQQQQRQMSLLPHSPLLLEGLARGMGTFLFGFSVILLLEPMLISVGQFLSPTQQQTLSYIKVSLYTSRSNGIINNKNLKSTLSLPRLVLVIVVLDVTPTSAY